MMIRPLPSNGRVVEGDTPWGRFRVEWDAAGKLISESVEIRRPPEPIPADFDPNTLKHGGCCDPPTVGTE